jgi:hypothetical protein
MTTSSTDETAPRPDRVVVASGDWSDLSRRIARRTTDLIAIALLLAAGLTIARRVVVWWKTEPGDLRADPEYVYSSDALAPWGIAPGGTALDLGELPLSLHREALRGAKSNALDRLRGECRTTLVEADGALLDALPPVSESESRLLTQLAAQPAAESGPNDRWALYDVPGPLPMVLGVHRGLPPDATPRVVSWGLVLPLGEDAWSILRVTPQGAGSGPADRLPVSLPADARRGLALRDSLGGSLVTFTGTGPPAAWRRHFDQLAEDNGWTIAAIWRTDPAAWSAAWILTREGEPQRLDLQLTRTDAGWSGLVNIAPAKPVDSQQQDQP